MSSDRFDADHDHAGPRSVGAKLEGLSRQCLERERAGDRTAADHALAQLVALSIESGELGPLITWVRASGVARSAARRFLFDDHDVSDTEQMTLIVVATKIADHRGGSFRSWVWTIASNEAKMLIRARDRRRRRDDVSEAVDGPPTGRIARISSLVADQQLVQNAIDELSPDYRKAFLLREVQEMDYQLIAQQLGIPVNTAKTRVRRARHAVEAAVIERFVP